MPHVPVSFPGHPRPRNPAEPNRTQPNNLEPKSGRVSADGGSMPPNYLRPPMCPARGRFRGRRLRAVAISELRISFPMPGTSSAVVMNNCNFHFTTKQTLETQISFPATKVSPRNLRNLDTFRRIIISAGMIEPIPPPASAVPGVHDLYRISYDGT